MARLLASAAYDPAVAANASTATATVMTAIDTTNLRLTPTIPASGFAVVRMRTTLTGGTVNPQILLGVLQSATVVCRLPPMGTSGGLTLNAANEFGLEAYAVIPGLSPGAATWDMAYGVEVVAASGLIAWGGPNDATGNDAFGAAVFEVWDPGPTLLGAKLYDPSTAATKNTGLAAMVAIDTTNLRLTVTAPASGQIFWRARCVVTGANTAPAPSILLGILEGSNVVARTAPITNNLSGASTFPYITSDASGIMSGVSAGSHTYDLAWAVQKAGGSVNYKIKYGGPNNTTADDAWGAISFELWDPAAVDTVMLVG